MIKSNIIIKTKLSFDVGIFWAPFPHWKTLRSFVISTLREEGMGKAAMEPRILEEVEQYIEAFVEPNLGQAFDMTNSLNRATANIISRMLYSKRFDYSDPNFNRLIAAINETILLNTQVARYETLPFGKYFTKTAIERERYLIEKVLVPGIQEFIDEHKQSLDSDNPGDITDRYLAFSQKSDIKEEPYLSGKLIV